MMKVDKDGNVTIRLYDLFRDVTTEVKVELIDALAIQDDIVEEVMAQVVNGATSLGSNAGRSRSTIVANWGLDKAIQDVTRLAGGVAEKELQRLQELATAQSSRMMELSGQLATVNGQLHDSGEANKRLLTSNRNLEIYVRELQLELNKKG